MKTFNNNLYSLIVALATIICCPNYLTAQTTVPFTSTTTWTCPYGVSSVIVECWGGGGAGGGGNDNSKDPSGGGGGAGGAYAKKTMAVTPGTTYTVTVGATKTGGTGAGGQGNPSWFSSTSTVYAEGGAGGAEAFLMSVAGGTGSSASSIGDQVYAGGNGATGETSRAGAGGGGAGSTGVGGNASGVTAGTGTSSNGGAGGNGLSATEGNGSAGSTYGGGGGGAYISDNTDHTGGSGAAGYVAITYTPVASLTFTIGNSGDDFVSITSAASSLATAGIACPVILEIQTDYAEGSETYPITFNNIAGTSSSNTVIFRPASDVTALVNDGDPGNTNTLITFSSPDYITFDGRPGGTGSTSEWTIQNTNSSTTGTNRGSTFRFLNDATNNTLKYLTIEGDAYYNKGIINFSTTTASVGNDDNTISYCTIQNYSNTTYVPGSAIYSLGTASKTNSGNIVEYCKFIDIFGADVSAVANIDLSTNNTAWTIRNNDFYKNAATDFVTARTNANGHYFIRVTDGGTYVIQSNDFGGTAVDAGGATKYTIAGAHVFYPIYFAGSASSQTNNIYSNKVSNIDFSTTYTSSAVIVFGAFIVSGSGDFNIGNTVSEANTIGSTTIANDIIVTNNAASGTLGFHLIRFTATGTSSKINYNNIGGVTLNGTRSSATSNAIRVTAGTVTVDNNVIGNSVADNIIITSNSDFNGIYSSSTNGITVTNNTIRNIDDNSSGSTFYGIYNSTGAFICTSNTISNISSANAGVNNYMILHIGTTATISSNYIHAITIENAAASNFIGIFMNTSSAVTASSNTIGSTVNNNISFAGDGIAHGIYKDGSGASTFDDNIIQEFNLTSTGSSSFCYAIRNLSTSGVLTSLSRNIIREIDYYGTRTGNTLSGITQEYDNTSGSHLIEGNTIYNLNSLTTSSIANETYGAACLGIGNFKKNMIYGLTSKTTSTSAYLEGVWIAGTRAWQIHNNVVLLNNGSNTNDLYLYGIDEGSSGNSTVYHNTSKIYGSVANATRRSAAFFRPTAGTDVIKNNIFQNLRTRSAGTAGQYAEYYSTTTNATTDKNYLEVSADLNQLGYWTADKAIAAWNTSPSANSISGSNTVDAVGGVGISFSGADLGADINATVGTDFVGNARNDGTPWMGAYEGGSFNLWTGLISSDWSTVSNWLAGVVPVTTNDVILPSGKTYYPNIDESDAVCGALRLDDGATLTVSSGELTVGGKFDCDGTLTMSNGTLDVNGEFELSASSVINITGGTIECSGEWDGVLSSGFDPSGGTVVMDGGSSNNISNHASSYFYNLSVDRPSQVVTQTSNLTVNNNLTITNGTLSGNSNNLNVGGIWSNSGTYSPSTGTVTFNGTSNQSIAGSTISTFYNLTNSNSNTGLTLNRGIVVSNTLSMAGATANINLNGFNIDLSTTGTLSGESNTDRIYGTSGYIIATDRALSSTSTTYSDIAGLGVNITTGSGSVPGNTTINRGHAAQSGGAGTSILRYYDITPTTNSSLDVTLRFYYYDNELNGQSADEADFALYRSTDAGATWIIRDGTVNTGSNYIELASIDAFSRWTVSGKNNNPLPISLVAFNAIPTDNSVELNWTTSAEVNNDYFTIERSSDGLFFESIAKVDGAGNSNQILNYQTIDNDPILGTSYYRLKQTDFNGKFEYFPIISVFFGKPSSFSFKVSPNPISQYQSIRLQLMGDETEVVNIAIHDLFGKSLYKQEIIMNKAEKFVNIASNMTLSAGVYLISCEYNGELFLEKLIVR